MTRQGRRRRGRLVMVLAGLALAAWGVWGALYVASPPTLALRADRAGIGIPGTMLEAQADGVIVRGVVRVRLEIVQGDRSATLAEQELRGPSVFEFWKRTEPRTVTLACRAARGEPDWLAEGTATIRLVAERATGPLRREMVTEVSRELPVRFRPPRLETLSAGRIVRQGGSGAIRLRVGKAAIASGVRVGDIVFDSWADPSEAPGERIVIYGIPWDLTDVSRVVVFAEDAAGNRVDLPFLDRIEPRRIRRDRIELTESFLARVVPAIIGRLPDHSSSGPLLEDYLFINGDLRAQNRAFLQDLGRAGEPGFSWEGGFAQLPGSKRMAGFAEVRTYVYEGREVDQQTHLGLDVASTRQAEVPAAAPGRVAFAGFLGIYGNFVVLDHGYGVMTGYAHLSRIDVSEGTDVERGAILGRTGRTGLAGGDHLHFGVFVRGMPVDPIEWMDRRWIRTHILPHVGMPKRDPDGT